MFFRVLLGKSLSLKGRAGQKWFEGLRRGDCGTTTTETIPKKKKKQNKTQVRRFAVLLHSVDLCGVVVSFASPPMPPS